MKGGKRQREGAKLSPSPRESAARSAARLASDELNPRHAPPQKQARRQSPPTARSSKLARPRGEFDFIEAALASMRQNL